MRKIFIAMLLFSSAHIADAEEIGMEIDEKLVKCSDSVQEGSPMEAMSCYDAAADAWEAEINKQFKLQIKGQTNEIQSTLQKAQDAWVIYKDLSFEALDRIFSMEQQGATGLATGAFFKMRFLKNKAMEFNEEY